MQVRGPFGTSHAQLYLTCNEDVAGSTPVAGSTIYLRKRDFSLARSGSSSAMLSAICG